MCEYCMCLITLSYSVFRIEVTIRIKCVKALVNGPNNDQKEHLCQLVKDGIKKYWEREITWNGGRNIFS